MSAGGTPDVRYSGHSAPGLDGHGPGRDVIGLAVAACRFDRLDHAVEDQGTLRIGVPVEGIAIIAGDVADLIDIVGRVEQGGQPVAVCGASIGGFHDPDYERHGRDRKRSGVGRGNPGQADIHNFLLRKRAVRFR